MITQTFMLELELSMIRSFATANRKSTQASTGINVALQQNAFLSEFMAAFATKRALLEAEIAKGGHRNPAKLMDKVAQIVEQKVRTGVASKQLQSKALDERSFKLVIDAVKTDARSVFYEGYLGGR